MRALRPALQRIHIAVSDNNALARWLRAGGTEDDWHNHLNAEAREAMTNPRPAPPVVTPIRGHAYTVAGAHAWCSCGHYLGGPGWPGYQGVETRRDVPRSRHQLHLVLVGHKGERQKTDQT